MFGFFAFGQSYFAQVPEFAVTPPTPPFGPITPVRAGSSQPLPIQYQRELLIQDLINEEIDEEDVMQIISLWMGIKH